MVEELQIIVLDQIELNERIQEAPVLRHDARTPPGDRREVMLIVGEAGAPAAHPAVLLPGRIAAVDLRALMEVLELVDDLTAVVVREPADEELPRVGLLQLADAESGEPLLLNTNHQKLRSAYNQLARSRRETLTNLLRGAGADQLEVSTAGGHLESLLAFFHRREKRK